MTTIVNSPTPTQESGGSGFLIGAIFLVAFVAVLVYFGIPAINKTETVELNVPAPQVSLPENLNVNVTQPE